MAEKYGLCAARRQWEAARFAGAHIHLQLSRSGGKTSSVSPPSSTSRQPWRRSTGRIMRLNQPCAHRSTFWPRSACAVSVATAASARTSACCAAFAASCAAEPPGDARPHAPGAGRVPAPDRRRRQRRFDEDGIGDDLAAAGDHLRRCGSRAAASRRRSRRSLAARRSNASGGRSFGMQAGADRKPVHHSR